MKKKVLLSSLIIVLGTLFSLNIAARHAKAVCFPDPTGFAICPIPAPTPDSTVTSSAPAPNTINRNPPSTTWPGSGAWSGGSQPYYDVGNDTDYPKNSNVVPIYLRIGDIIDLTVTNASPDCQATDSGTGLKYPDYSDNATDAGPATTFSLDSTSYDSANGKSIRGPKTIGSNASCSTTVSWTSIHAYTGDVITINGKPVDKNGVSNSGYYYVINLHISVSRTDPIKGENAFRVSLTNTSGNDSNIASGSDAVGYGYRVAPLAYGNVYTQEVVFGADESCSNFAQTRSGSLTYTDMDANNLNWNPDIRIVLQRESWKNGAADGWSNWNTIETISNQTLRGQVNGTLHTLSTQSFDFHFRYRLLLENVGVRNTIFIGLTGDISQISGKYHITGDDCSSFSCTATPISATGVTVQIKNLGPFPAGKGFQLRQTPDAQSWPASGFSSNFTVGGTTSFTFTRPADAVENYTLYDGTGASAEVVGKKPLCKASNNNITAECLATTVTVATGQSGYNGQIKISWLDSGNNDVGDYVLPLPATSQLTTTKSYDTFKQFPALWPHNAYTAELFVGTASGFPPTPNDTDTLSLCLHGACPPTPTQVTGEVGVTQNETYTFPLANDTDKEFASGYSVTISVSPGLVLQSPPTQTIDVQAGPGTNDAQVKFKVIANYDGYFSIHLNYNGSPISLGSWPGSCTAPVGAETLPYYQVWNSDISTGGGFGDAKPGEADPNTIGACNQSYPYVSASGNPYSGGIVGFAEEQSFLGSQVDYGVVAMGLVAGTPGGPVGFFSGSPVNGLNHTNYPSPKPVFANNINNFASTNMGGYLNGSPPDFHCVKDYYDDTQSSPDNSSGNLQTDINTCGVGNRCQYKYTGNLTISGACLPPQANVSCPGAGGGVSNQVTLYVAGNVTITGNITYPAIFDASTPAHMPYLTIIAKGNIILTDGVSQLDGLYIAQPSDNTGTDGVFATCNNGSDVTSPDPSASQNPCNNQLVVNGAVITEHLELLRTHGTLHQPPTDVNGIGHNPAEIFNYVPSMVIGTPAFPASFGQTDGIYNLPPVF